jgi:hypothetical protein
LALREEVRIILGMNVSPPRRAGESLHHEPCSGNSAMDRTAVYDTYWRFAAERQAIYQRRLTDFRGPWTDDPILRNYRFTNTYRAADRVSQFLIREVQYRGDRSQAPAEVFFRTLFFKIFNKIETWQLVEEALGPVSWQSFDLNAVEKLFDSAMLRGERIYSAAYIMPAPAFGRERKHANHLALLAKMMDDNVAARVAAAGSLSEVYQTIRPYPGLGPFLAFQYTIDLNYSELLDFDEDEFVVAGPGALDGIAKCFADAGEASTRDVIAYMVENQRHEFDRLGLDFQGLFGRPLKLIDCQNVFCEISKYARVAHPDVKGVSDRKRIKQVYRPAPSRPEQPTFPPRWHLVVPDTGRAEESQYNLESEQLCFF